MFKTKEWLLVGAILLDVALGSAHATPFDGVLVIAQAPQADQEKEKEKKPPQCPLLGVKRTSRFNNLMSAYDRRRVRERDVRF